MKSFKEFLTENTTEANETSNLNEGLVYSTANEIAQKKFAKGKTRFSDITKDEFNAMDAYIGTQQAYEDAAEVLAKRLGGKVAVVRNNGEIVISLANNSSITIVDPSSGYETNIRLTLFVRKDSEKVLADIMKLVKSSNII